MPNNTLIVREIKNSFFGAKTLIVNTVNAKYHDKYQYASTSAMKNLDSNGYKLKKVMMSIQNTNSDKRKAILF